MATDNQDVRKVESIASEIENCLVGSHRTWGNWVKGRVRVMIFWVFRFISSKMEAVYCVSQCYLFIFQVF